MWISCNGHSIRPKLNTIICCNFSSSKQDYRFNYMTCITKKALLTTSYYLRPVLNSCTELPAAQNTLVLVGMIIK